MLFYFVFLFQSVLTVCRERAIANALSGISSVIVEPAAINAPFDFYGGDKVCVAPMKACRIFLSGIF
jgi:hypothetical protein